ncbi:MAG: hypothetical protein KI790_17865 [Cyclobacteriaceae bacterium]|nr:hypothetical protein [Cyclobacteriaceae bacterium HetDA_MAG_MS6]
MLKILRFPILPALFFMACTEEESSNLSFTRIFDDLDFHAVYRPVGVQQTIDGGFVILSGINQDNSDYQGIRVLKADNDGNIQFVQSLANTYVSPAPGLLEKDSMFYFFCMLESNFTAQIGTIDQDGNTTVPQPVDGNLSFPLAAAQDANNFILLGYDAVDNNSTLTIVGEDGSLVDGASYSIGAGNDADQLVLDHLISRDKKLPFFAGQSSSGRYYFNSIYNFGLSLVFTDLGGTPTGVLQGQFTDGGISSVFSHESGTFSLSGFQIEENFVRNNIAINESGIDSSIDFLDRDVPEIRTKGASKIVSLTLGNDTFTVVAAETESRQIALYFFDSDSALIATHYIGYINPFTLSEMIPTQDEGLAVLGTTYLAGRFERIFLNKISRQELGRILP